MATYKGALVFCLAGLGAASVVSAPHVDEWCDPVDPSTTKDCTFFDTAGDESYTCKYFENTWNLSHEEFVEWNPSVKNDCSGIKVGNAYCVSVQANSGGSTTTSEESTTTITMTTSTTVTQSGPSSMPPKPTTSSKRPRPTTPPNPTTTIAPTSTTEIINPAKPTPTQAGIIGSCTSFYRARQGDTCFLLVQRLGTITLEDFYAWNPAVGTDCSGLVAGFYYCVAAPTSASRKPTSAPISTPPPPAQTQPPTGCSARAPMSTQPGSLCGCRRWHKVRQGDTCQAIEQTYGLSDDDFQRWNPTVGGAACGALWLGYNVCVQA